MLLGPLTYSFSYMRPQRALLLKEYPLWQCCIIIIIIMLLVSPILFNNMTVNGTKYPIGVLPSYIALLSLFIFSLIPQLRGFCRLDQHLDISNR